MRARGKAAAAAVLICLLAAGCGGGGGTDRQVDLLIPDCSASFRAASMRLIPEMIAIARDSAEKGHVLWSGCFAAAPLRKLKWRLKVDFGEFPPGVEVGTPVADSFAQARAIGLKPKVERMIRTTKQTARGSGQLEALEVASQAPDLAAVYLLTDAAVHEHGVPNLHDATPAQIQQTIQRWAPRLAGLRGADLMLLGAGYGQHNSTSVRKGRKLFKGLAESVGTASYMWVQELPPGFP